MIEECALGNVRLGENIVYARKLVAMSVSKIKCLFEEKRPGIVCLRHASKLHKESGFLEWMIVRKTTSVVARLVSQLLLHRNL